METVPERSKGLIPPRERTSSARASSGSIAPNEEERRSSSITNFETNDSKSIQEPTSDGDREGSGDCNKGQHAPLGFRVIAISVSVMLCVFIIELDKTVTTTASPRITADFSSLYDVGWYGTGYMIPYMSLLPVFGKLFSLIDIRALFVFMIIIFEVGSIVCAIASTSPIFILGRIIAGIGAAGQISGGLTVISFIVPLEKRALYYSILSSMNGVAALSGPVISGAFMDNESLTWRWCFWINPPIGVLCVALLVIALRSHREEGNKQDRKQIFREMDLGGALLFIATTTCLLVALQRGGEDNDWGKSTVWPFFFGFGFAFLGFISLELYLKDSAMIPPHILSQLSVVSACLFAALPAAGNFVHVYFLPFFFQNVKGYSAKTSGLFLVPYLISIVVASLVAGALVNAFGKYKYIMAVGAALFSAGSSMLYTLKPDSNAGVWIAGQILAGSGIGSSAQLTAVATQALLPQKDVPIANSLIMLMMILGGVLGLSIGESIFSATLTNLLRQLGYSSTGINKVTAGVINTPEEASGDAFLEIRAALSNSITRAFILPIVAGGLSLLVVWGIRQKNLRMEQAPSSDEEVVEDNSKEI